MTAKFRGKEIETVVLDLDGTMYPEEKLEAMWEGVRRELAIVALNIDGHDPSDDEVSGFVEKMVEMSQGAGWRESYKMLGGDPEKFVEIADGANRAEYLDYDPELVEVLRKLSLNGVAWR